MLITRFTFRDTERLKRKKLIDQLFASGKSFYIHPFKVIWLLTANPLPSPAQVLISVGKRAMKRAVDRNSVKRQVRELYRQQKGMIGEYLIANNRHVLIGIIFTGNEILPHSLAKEKINMALARLLREMKRETEH